MPLPFTKQYRTGDQPVDETQRSLAALTEALTAGELGSPNFISTVFGNPLAAAAANATIPVVTATSTIKLLAVKLSAITAIAASGVNNRVFAVLRYRGGNQVATMASRDTTVAGVSALTPFDITLGTGTADVIADKDDVIVVSITGAGATPLADGCITFNWGPQ